MRRFFNIVLGALAMIAIALLSAFITMRLAIHGREVEIPNVAGLTVAEANSMAANLGLNLSIENHFYSTVTPSGRVLSQYPLPGTKVRREWVMRITESIGPQKISVPSVVGQTEREASVTIRRLSLDLGTVAYIPVPGPAGVVLAQTPTPAATGVDGPRISLLVSEPIPAPRTHPVIQETSIQSEPQDKTSATGETAASGGDTDRSSGIAAEDTAAPQADAYVMPNLVGLTLSAAFSRVASMGLRISSVEAVPATIKPVGPVASPGSTDPNPETPVRLKPITPIVPITLSNTVVAQRPAAGRRVTKEDSIHVTLSH